MPPHSCWVRDRHLSALQSLAVEIKLVEERLAESIAQDAIAQRLLAEPGIGLVTAATLRAEIGRFDRFRNGKQLCRFCGLSPRNASSGARQADAGLIQASNRELRRVLIEVGHRLINHTDAWNDFAKRMWQRGKPRSLVVAAVANRWMRYLYHDLKGLAA
jgi:transposase